MNESLKVSASCQTFQLQSKPGLSSDHVILESPNGAVRLKIPLAAFPNVIPGFGTIVTLGITQIVVDEDEPKFILPKLQVQ